jgi:AcrR family transcriptional regulator
VPRYAVVATEVSDLRERLLIGTATTIAQVGWDRTSVSKISQRVGLTSGAFYPRFADRHEAATTLWVEQIHEVFVQHLTEVVVALDAEDEERFVSAMLAFATGSTALDVAVELLVAAQFDDDLAAVIGHDLGPLLTERCRDDDAGASAAKMLAVVVGLGFTLLRHRPWAEGLVLEPSLRQLFAGLTHRGPVVPLPDVRAQYLLHPAANSGDPLIDAFYDGGFTLISEVGYAKASLKEICQRAGLTTGFLFARHDGKLDFFFAIIRQGWKANIEKGIAFTREVAATYGQLVADAIIIREFSHPDYRAQVRCNLELQRLARFNGDAATLVANQEQQLFEQMQRGAPDFTREAFAMEMAMGAGVIFTSLFVSDLWTYDFIAPLSSLSEAQEAL